MSPVPLLDEIEHIARRHGLSGDCLRELVDAISEAEVSPLSLSISWGPTEPATASTPPARYIELGPLGAGGMGEVLRVRDTVLGRVVALKRIRTDGAGSGAWRLQRFTEEARITAQLEHPGVVPVYDLGAAADGAPCYTMREVHGQTLKAVIRAVHSGEEGLRWRRLVDVFWRTCQAVAYAHSRGVLHRDLKPSNIMIGDFGEVYVMDWGLARVLHAPAADAPDSGRPPKAAWATRAGDVAGTPAYMAPEQARGALDRLDARADVYALGSILYEILAGSPPYRGDGSEVLAAVLAGPPRPLRTLLPAERQLLLAELVEVCERAMARETEARYPDAGALAEAVAAWLEGARRREQALTLVAEADAHAARVTELRSRTAELRAAAAAALAGVAPHEPEARKQDAWAQQDEADRREREAEREELLYQQTLRAALNLAPDLPEAHDRLAAFYADRHREAEARRDPRTAEAMEVLLRAHDRGQHARYLRGEGALTLVTDPPGAEALLHRYEPHNRRLVPVFERSPGTTPLQGVPLPMGSYLVVLRAPGRAEVRYPVFIGRQERWDGIRPGEDAPHPVLLPPEGELEPDDIYVPAGWYWSGGDAEAFDSLPRRRVWVDAFAIRRYSVTNAEFLLFLNDLVAQGREVEALRCVPRERGASANQEGAPVYHRDADGRFFLGPDADGDLWLPGWPVFQVDFRSSLVYAEWYAARRGQPWRLPGEYEWEKAARGVDGRFYPWGDAFDPSWCCMRESRGPNDWPAEVGEFAADETPYGAREMGGNARNWTGELWAPEGAPLGPGGLALPPDLSDLDAQRALHGGSWGSPHRMARGANRNGWRPINRYMDLSFRLARSL